MALSLKVDTEEIPSILKMFGLGGSDASAPETVPPVDSSMGGADNPTEQPAGTSDASAPSPGPTKLLRLQQALSGGMNTPAPQPEPVPNDPNAMPPAGIIQSMLQGKGQEEIKPTFREHHPIISNILRGVLTTAQGGAVGTGAQDFGAGFDRASQYSAKQRGAALANQKAQADIAQTQAKTKEIQGHAEDIPVVVNGQTYFIPKDKSTGIISSLARSSSNEKIANTKNATQLRKQGLTIDENGKAVPLGYDDLSPAEQAHIDLQQSQKDAADARAALDKSKNDPNSPAYKAAYGRLRVAQQNANTALGRLGVEKAKYNANYFGTDADGNALPGIPLTENDTPIGTTVANISKPTNSTRSKAEQAGVIKQQGEDILKQIDSNPDLFGVVAGRWNEFNAGKFGNAPQDVRDAYTSLKSFAALQPALHGARGIGMMKEFEDAVGTMANNPEGLKGSIQSLLRTSAAFQKAGTMKTNQGTKAAPTATHIYDPSTGTIAPVKK